MARIPDIERRLLNWARWNAQMQDGGGNYATCAMDVERVDKSGAYATEYPIPTNDAEAEITEQAVRALEPTLRETVIRVYIKGGGMRDKAKRLGVSEATVYARIDQAHRAISSWLDERTRAAEAQRLRVEGLQRAVGRF